MPLSRSEASVMPQKTPGKMISPAAGTALVATVILTATTALAQPLTTNLVASKTVVLGTKTPLGEATIALPAGTVLTNCEVLGDKAVIRQGPFAATVALEELQQPSTPPPAATAPLPIAADSPAPDTSPSPPASSTPEATPRESAGSPDEQVPADAITSRLPDWVVPAAGGALVAYALFTTATLLRTRRRRPRRIAPATTPAPETDKTPIVAIPSKAAPKPAVVAEGGKAIACPLCGKSIPLEKISAGRNSCPSCQGQFVGV